MPGAALGPGHWKAHRGKTHTPMTITWPGNKGLMRVEVRSLEGQRKKRMSELLKQEGLPTRGCDI